MFFNVLGIVVGLAVTVGPFRFLSAPFDSAAGALVRYGSGAADTMLTEVGRLPYTSTMVQIAAPLVGAVLPGFIALTVAWVSRAADKARQVGAALLLIAGVVSFFVVDASTAMVVATLALLTASLMGITGGLVLRVPLAALTTSMAVTMGRTLFDPSNPVVSRAVDTIMVVAPFGDPQPWRLALVVTGLAPFVAAVWFLVRE